MVKFRPLQCAQPPSSSGLGRSPLKAKTGVRVPVGAQVLKDRSVDDVERFLSLITFKTQSLILGDRHDIANDDGIIFDNNMIANKVN